VNKQEIRLECYRIAVDEERKRPGLRVSPTELAKSLASFCEEDDLRLSAVHFAFALCDPRADLGKVMDQAQTLLDFAHDKKPKTETPQPQAAPPARSSKKKTKARHSR